MSVASGVPEPWDRPDYVGRLALAGALSAVGRWRGHWWGPLGVCLGQVLYLHVSMATDPPQTPVILLPILSVGLFAGPLASGAGALTAGAIEGAWRLLRKTN